MIVIIYIIMVDYSIKMLWNSTYKVLLHNLPMIFINNSSLLGIYFVVYSSADFSLRIVMVL